MSEVPVLEARPQAPGESYGVSVCPSCGALSARVQAKGRRKKKAVEPPQDLQAVWLPLIHSSIQEVFEIMLGSKTGPGVDHTPGGSANITAMVGLAGKLRGMMSVRCTSRAASGMAAAMLGSSITDLNLSADSDDVKDALGELCNMVAGNFKAKLSGMADGCKLSVPTVITGADYQVHPTPQGEQVLVTCSFRGEPVWVTLDLRR